MKEEYDFSNGKRGQFYHSSIQNSNLKQQPIMLSNSKPSLYEQLEALPESIICEILNGQLHTFPRQSAIHGHIAMSIGGFLYHSFSKEKYGPDSWMFVFKPEIHLSLDTVVTVPDIVGWYRERVMKMPDTHKIEIIPNWICEILSPSTASKDREVKMPIYAEHGIQYAWLVDPKNRTLEAYALENGQWQQIGFFKNDDVISIAPFDAISIQLADLWC